MLDANFWQDKNSSKNVIKEKKLPVDHAHNGLLILSDGTIVTKDLRLTGSATSTITRLCPKNLELIGEPLNLPEGSMGRIASDFTNQNEYIYIPGIEHVWRIKVKETSLSIIILGCPNIEIRMIITDWHGMVVYLTIIFGLWTMVILIQFELFLKSIQMVALIFQAIDLAGEEKLLGLACKGY